MKKTYRNIKTYYGKETKKALVNFPISGIKPHTEFIKSTVFIKKSAASVNLKLGLLPKLKAEIIITVCNEILDGKLLNQFVVDVYQTGAGTSSNMNVNEVIANRGNEILNKPGFIHPNDDVNMSQSTNDVIPTAIRIATLFLFPHLQSNLTNLTNLFLVKSRQFSSIIKSGRTHLQDALPVTLGQEFGAYGKAISKDQKRLETAFKNLLNIGIGGTGVGTGINTHPKYHQLMIAELSKLTKLPLKSTGNLFESAQNTADFLDLSGSLRILSTTLIRIGNDLRLLSSGPLAGFAEIRLPEVQAGSSIMPGKVNPSIIEMLTMVCFQVIGFDQAILQSTQAGQLELNVMLPLIAYNLLEQVKLLTNSIKIFNTKCLQNIEADPEMCRFWFERSSGIAAILNPYLGYDKVAQLVKESLQKHKTIKDLIIEKDLLKKSILDKISSRDYLTKPNLNKKGNE